MLAVVCSFYSESFRGKPTASGEPFDPSAMTAASNHHPLGTKLRVTAGRRSVVVTVNDRISRRHGDRLDLSPRAFKELAPLDRGLIEANLQVLK
jgi:rare lipoprotein A